MVIEGQKRRGHDSVVSVGRYADAAALVLTSLAAGDKHGYALVKDIEEVSRVALGPGTLYGAIARLEQAGFIEALPADDGRHPYRITAAGAAALEQTAWVAPGNLALPGALA